jgi:hypothetical protein
MTKKLSNPVLLEITRLSRKFGFAPSSIASRAFKNSRKVDQLQRRDKGDAAALEKLNSLEITLDAERVDRVARLYPEQALESPKQGKVS